jgi:hypothetical protein
MPEREVIIDKLRMTYEGLFSVAELYTMIDEWFREKGYDKKESKNIEVVRPEGKQIELVLEPWKKVTDYAKNIIKIRILMTDIKDVEVEKDHTKVKLNQGKIQLVFDAFMETDYESRWEGKPIFYFIRTVFDKYFYKPFLAGFETGVKADTMDLHKRIAAFLNLYRMK